MDFRSSTETVDVDHVLVLGSIAAFMMVVLYHHFALWHRHPSELPIMGMNSGLLSRLPANRHDFEKLITIDQIACVKLVAPPDVILERLNRNRGGGHATTDDVARDGIAFQRDQIGDEIFNSRAYRTRHSSRMICVRPCERK